MLVGGGAFSALSTVPFAVFTLALVQGALSFAVGSTLIAASIRAAVTAPTMSGSFATASLNIGAAAGPILGGLAYARTAGATGPLAPRQCSTALRGSTDVRNDTRDGEVMITTDGSKRTPETPIVCGTRLRRLLPVACCRMALAVSAPRARSACPLTSRARRFDRWAWVWPKRRSLPARLVGRRWLNDSPRGCCLATGGVHQ